MVDQSIERYGAGRSIVVDKNGNIIGGNKTVKAAQEAGMEIEPKYCAVILERMSDMGLTPELIENVREA